jgi:hypothetical protein
VAVVSGATFDALTFPMFSGLLFLIIGCAGAYLGLMKAQGVRTAGGRGLAPGNGTAPGHSLAPGPSLPMYRLDTVWGPASGADRTAGSPRPATPGPGSGQSGGSTSAGHHGGAMTAQHGEGNS